MAKDDEPFYVKVDLKVLARQLAASRRGEEDGQWYGDDGSVDSYPDRCERDELLIFGRLKEVSALTEFFGSDEAFSDVMARGCGLGDAIDAKNEGYRRLWILMGMQPEIRQAAVSRAPYRDLYVAELLLLECSKAIPERLDSADKMALTALWIAEQPFPEDEERREEIWIRALCAQADVLRLRRDFAQAEQKLLMALGTLDGPPECMSRMRIAEALAALREDQGRFEEAIALLLHTGSIAKELDRPGQDYESLARAGFLSLAQNDPGRAMGFFVRLCAGLALSPSSWLTDTTLLHLGRAACLAAVDLAEPARKLLAQARPIHRRFYQRDETLAYEWLECKVSIRLGDLEEAVPRLEALLRRFVWGKELFKTCLCALDLAWAYAKRGTVRERLPALLREVARLPQAVETAWALGSLWKFRDALDRGASPESAAWQASQILRRRDGSTAILDGPSG